MGQQGAPEPKPGDSEEPQSQRAVRSPEPKEGGQGGAPELGGSEEPQSWHGREGPERAVRDRLEGAGRGADSEMS